MLVITYTVFCFCLPRILGIGSTIFPAQVSLRMMPVCPGFFFTFTDKIRFFFLENTISYLLYKFS